MQEWNVQLQLSDQPKVLIQLTSYENRKLEVWISASALKFLYENTNTFVADFSFWEIAGNCEILCDTIAK